MTPTLTRPVFMALIFTAALVCACSGSGGNSNGAAAEVNPTPVALPPGFATSHVLFVSSENTDQSLAALSLDPATGALGLLPGSPIDVGIRISDAETLAADPSRRRVFFGSNLDGLIAVVTLDAQGGLAAVAGSPFAVERVGVSVIEVSSDGLTLYVGYHAESRISRYGVDATSGALTLLQSVDVAQGVHTETMKLDAALGVLYVGFQNNALVGLTIDGNGAFQTNAGAPVLAANQVTAPRPDFVEQLGSRLYLSLADGANSLVEAYDIGAGGGLTELPGSPFAFPGVAAYEPLAISPGGDLIAVGAEVPTAGVVLYRIESDGSLTPLPPDLPFHSLRGGPEGLAFSPTGDHLFVADHIFGGLFVLEVQNESVDFATPAVFDLPGAQIDVLIMTAAVSP